MRASSISSCTKRPRMMPWSSCESATNRHCRYRDLKEMAPKSLADLIGKLNKSTKKLATSETEEEAEEEETEEAETEEEAVDEAEPAEDEDCTSSEPIGQVGIGIREDLVHLG